MTDRTRPLTSSEVADIFGVSVASVASWADEGKLRSFRTPGGHRRFRRDDIDAFIADQERLPEAVGE